jgi:hypothetical protein
VTPTRLETLSGFLAFVAMAVVVATLVGLIMSMHT